MFRAALLPPHRATCNMKHATDGMQQTTCDMHHTTCIKERAGCNNSGCMRWRRDPSDTYHVYTRLERPSRELIADRSDLSRTAQCALWRFGLQDAMRCDAPSRCAAWHGMAWHDMTWHGMACGTVRQQSVCCMAHVAWRTLHTDCNVQHEIVPATCPPRGSRCDAMRSGAVRHRRVHGARRGLQRGHVVVLAAGHSFGRATAYAVVALR